MTPAPNSTPTSRRGLSPLEAAVLGLFFLSGASALIYEVVWSRDLTNVFGGSAFAIATVLAAFMAGLALGSARFGRVIDRRGNPLVVYALLEGGIAGWALLVPVLFHLLDRVYAGLFRSMEPGFTTLSLVRFVLSFLVLLVPTTLMGGTLPVLGKFLLTRWERLGERAGLLYASNTLGAVVGTAAGGFLLLPTLGLRGTTLVAAAANLLVALLALALSRKLREREARGGDRLPTVEPRGGRPAGGPSPGLARTVLWVYAASGFAALAYEVAWTKTLASILGTTTYAFTSMLVTFLLGLSLGSLLFAKLADRTRRPDVLLAAVQLGIPLLTLATIPVMEQLPQLFVDGFARLENRWFALELYRILLAGATMFLPTLLMGGMFPLVTRVYLGPDRTATRLGRLYAANTMGAILGSFVTGFILVPWLGRQDSILAAAVVNMVAAALLLVVIGRGIRGRRARWAFAALGVLLVPAWVAGTRPWNPRVVASGAYIYAPTMPRGSSVLDLMKEESLLFYADAAEANVSVWSAGPVTVLRINGKIDASSHGDMLTQKMLAHLPALYHPAPPQNALLIGLASGISAGVLLRYPLAQLETVELVPSVAKAARFFDRYNYRCLDDPRHRLVINDGRNLLLLTDHTYDLQVSEPTNPWVAGVGSLFTREFFELTKARLKPGGIVCLWVQTYQYQVSDLRTVLATILDAYPDLHVWSGAPGDLIVVASMEPLVLDLDRVRAAIAGPPGEDLASMGILPLPQILASFVTDRAGVEEFVGDWDRRVTDDNLYLEYAVPRHMFQVEGRVDVTTLAPVARSIVPHLTGSGIDSALVDEIGRFRRARTISVRAHLRAEFPPGASTPEETYRRALREAPGEQTATSFLSHDLNEDAIHALAAGDTARAQSLFHEAVGLGDPGERALALNDLGMIAFQRGFSDTAALAWAAAREDEPEHPTVLYNLAVLANREGRRSDALDLYRRAIARQPDNPTPLNNLAYLLAQMGESLDEAERCARRAVAHDPASNNRDTLGFVLVKRGKWREAERILAPIVESDPGAWESLYHLALAQAGRGDAGRARGALERVVSEASDPNLVSLARDALGKL